MADSANVISQSKIDAANVTYRAIMAELFTDVQTGLDALLAERVSAAGAASATLIVEDYLGTWAEFLGARVTSVSRAYSQTVTLTTWEQTLRIARKQMAYDPTGVVAQRLQRFLSAQASYYDTLVFDALVSASGAGPTGYDGVALLATTHPNGPAGNQSNKGTTALSQTSFDTAFTAMTSLQRENGQPFNIVPKTLLVGPKLRQRAMEITQADIRGQAVDNAGLESGTRIGTAGVTNVYRGVVDLVISPKLVGTYDDYWYLLGEGPGGMKPFIFLEGMAPTEQIDSDLSSPTVMQNDAFTFGLIADAQVGAGAWQTIYAGIL